MNLVIDIGNSFTKLSLFENNKEVKQHRLFGFSLSGVQEFAKNLKIDKCILSATGHISEEDTSMLQQEYSRLLIFNHKVKMPFRWHYETPETIGLDRLAAMAGVYSLYPGQNVMVIDAGTAITFDFINQENEYLGGNISPGMQMRFKALNHYTEKLPLIEPTETQTLLGVNTKMALSNGVINGILFEIEGVIASMEENYTNLTVLLTGGDAQFFDNKLKKTIFVLQNLVSIGLNTILNYNVETH
jgi:type III pantothenate kinase